MIRFDTATGQIAIDTEKDPLKDRVVITRGRAGVKIQYEQPATRGVVGWMWKSPEPVGSVKTFFSRVLQFDF